jgi:hypothetical protein
MEIQAGVLLDAAVHGLCQLIPKLFSLKFGVQAVTELVHVHVTDASITWAPVVELRTRSLFVQYLVQFIQLAQAVFTVA